MHLTQKGLHALHRDRVGGMQVPPEVYDLMGHAQKQGAEAEKKWDETWQQYKSKYPEVSARMSWCSSSSSKRMLSPDRGPPCEY